MKSSKLIGFLESCYRAEVQFIAELTEEESEAEGTFERWTAKDIIAHNSHWRKHHAENLLAALEGKQPTRSEDIDNANEEVYKQYRDQSWQAVEALAKSSCDRMKEALMALGEDGLERVDLFPWQEGRPIWRFLVGNAYTHPIIHVSDWHIKKGDKTRAAKMYQEMTGLLSDLDDSPDWQGTIQYNLACSYSLAGEAGKAITTLREALELNPSLTEWSQQDPDFEPIRDEPGYKALFK
jgi:tetratricopeptide (TPR) repeat protein